MTPPVSPTTSESTPSATSSSPAPTISDRRWRIMIVVVAAILLSVNAFVCATLGHFLGLRGWFLWQALPALFPIAFIAVTIISFRHSNPFLRTIYTVSAAWLGALNFAFFAAVACWVFSLPDRLAGWPVSRFDLAGVLFGLALAATVYGLINAARLRVTRITVHLPNLPQRWRGHTIALVTDLHLGRIFGPDFLRHVIARLRSLKPDAVLIGGDMFDGTTFEINELVAPWRDYSTPRGIFYVTGNHDEFEERTMYLDAAQNVGLRVLNNEKIDLDGLQLIGIHDSEAGDPAELRAILRDVHLDPNRPSILLAHRPVNLAIAEQAGISLQLSGHTHKGQIWPWSLLVSRIYGPFAYGLHRLNNLQVYTSSGAGTWGPPLRVATKSEIVLLLLEQRPPPAA